MVVQPAQNWDSDNGAGPLDCPTCGRVFAKRPVRADLIVIGRIRRKNLPQMRLAEDQHPVQALAAHCADQTLYIRILPRRSRRDRSVADTYRPHPRGEDKPDGIFGKDSEAVEDAALAQATMPRGLYCATRLPRSPFSAATAFAGTCSDHGRSVRARLSATGSQFLMDFLFLPNKALR
jgi:hypothetical protein